MFHMHTIKLMLYKIVISSFFTVIGQYMWLITKFANLIDTLLFLLIACYCMSLLNMAVPVNNAPR